MLEAFPARQALIFDDAAKHSTQLFRRRAVVLGVAPPFSCAAFRFLAATWKPLMRPLWLGLRWLTGVSGPAKRSTDTCGLEDCSGKRGCLCRSGRRSGDFTPRSPSDGAVPGPQRLLWHLRCSRRRRRATRTHATASRKNVARAPTLGAGK